MSSRPPKWDIGGPTMCQPCFIYGEGHGPLFNKRWFLDRRISSFFWNKTHRTPITQDFQMTIYNQRSNQRVCSCCIFTCPNMKKMSCFGKSIDRIITGGQIIPGFQNPIFSSAIRPRICWVCVREGRGLQIFFLLHTTSSQMNHQGLKSGIKMVFTKLNFRLELHLWFFLTPPIPPITPLLKRISSYQFNLIQTMVHPTVAPFASCLITPLPPKAMDNPPY